MVDHLFAMIFKRKKTQVNVEAFISSWNSTIEYHTLFLSYEDKSPTIMTLIGNHFFHVVHS